MKSLHVAILFVIGSVAGSVASYGAEISMHALVIGNSNYPAASLKNPANDANLMQQTLSDLGFEVTAKTDLNHQQMDEVVNEFCKRVPRGGVAFFFYAGHGVQDKHGRNYLVPLDAKLKSESSVKYQTMPLNFVMDALNESQSNLNVVVLDCCRDNPFERSWGRGVAPRGLAGVEAPEGTIIAYSTAPGNTASDGDGDNSAYTSRLANALKVGPQEGLPLLDIFRNASQDVKKLVGQSPYLEFDASMPKFHFPGTNVTSAKPSPNMNATPSAVQAATLPVATPTISVAVADPPLLQQALTYLNNRKYEFAIESFTAVITDPDTPREAITKARKGRGSTYLARRLNGDINRAIIDYTAAKAPGVSINVLADRAELKVGAEVTGNVYRNEIVLLTKSKGDWLWVESVQGRESRRGWVGLNSLLDDTSRAVAPANVAAKVTAKSAGPVVVEAKPVAMQPGISTSRPSSVSSTPGTTVMSSPNPVSGQSNAIGGIQSTAATSARQMIGIDQFGQPIYSQSQPFGSQSVTQGSQTGSTNAVTVDQFGRPILSTQSRPSVSSQFGMNGQTFQGQSLQSQPQQQFSQQQFSQQQFSQQQRPTQPQQQFQQRQSTNRPPRPPNAWETSGWESIGQARQMKASQEAWDRKYGN